MRCPSCSARLSRPKDIQLGLLAVLGSVAASGVVNLPIDWFYRLALFAALLVIGWLIDVATVRLVPANTGLPPTRGAT
jgi:hypothetical protein